MLVSVGRTTDPSVRLTDSLLIQIVPQPRTFPGGLAAKAPLVDGGEGSVDLVVAQPWGLGA